MRITTNARNDDDGVVRVGAHIEWENATREPFDLFYESTSPVIQPDVNAWLLAAVFVACGLWQRGWFQ